MIGLSSMGCGGGGNSSTSNLSASAPPFTVDRLNPKPNSNPMLHYSDYGVEPFTHSSQYPIRAEAAIDSGEMISVPTTDDYRFSASASVSAPSTQWSGHNSGYGGDVKPYYSPYVTSLVGEDRVLGEDEGSRYNVVPTCGLSVTPQHDYTPSLFDLEYGPRWVDGLGFDDGKRAKRSEVDGKFSSEKLFIGGSHGYENQLYQGGCGSENRNQFKEDSGVLYKNLHQVSDREVYTGSSSTGYMEDKSCLEQQFGFFHYDSSKTLLTASSPPYPESYPPLVSCATEKNFPNYKNSCSPYKKCIRPVDTPYQGRVSVGRSSPTVVIRPPPASSWNLGQGNASRKSAGSENAAGVHIVDSDYTYPSKPKDSGLKANSKPKEGSFETSPFKFFKQGNAPVSSASVKELRPLNTNDTSDSKVKPTLGSQMPDVNVSSSFLMTGDNIQMVNSTEESSDFIDNHSTAVDSPCWKGAPSSPFSVFDIESGNCDRVKVNLVEQYGFGHGDHPSLHSIDSNRVFSEKVECNMVNQNECGRNGMKLGFEKTLDAICSTSEQSLLDGITDRVWIPPATRSKGVELSGGITKDSNLLNNLTSVFDMNVSDTNHLFGEGCVGMTVNDVSEGAAVAVLAAEKVLASPASQEDAIEHTTVPDPRLDVSSIVKSMHSLSELLRFHIPSNVCPLGEENTEILKHVISNLSTCLSKNGIQAQASNKSEPKVLSGETSLGELCCADVISRGPRTKCEASNSCTNAESLHLLKGERNDTFPGKRDEISQIVSPPLTDDFHITGDDDMAKAIKKVLEQNFEIDEDMHSQALLFKNLWLEAEAKLCSISYKARFERMKVQMEDVKLKAPKEMKSELCVSPNSVIMSVLAPKACVDTSPKPTSPNVSASGVGGRADCIESSVLARFSILKSREENLKTINAEEQQRSEIVDANSIITRFNILKSREENLNPIHTQEQQWSEIVDGKHADSIMARFNILKSREESLKLVGADEEKPPQAISDEFAGEKYFQPLVRGQSEDEALDVEVGLQPDFQYQAGSLARGGKFDSYFERAGYEPPAEYSSGSIMNDAAIHVVKSGSRMVGENRSGWQDSSSSSEWEHVLKEDFSWKN
ncbi:uncharacterized protein LOC131016161 isoform X2 [Salvia miltiorrhiza]|uniref:uncharacterized protein LOC131016161 isoform X2 n=1 Tax=Salvia miltiorrhiza TaxID=226208 RepID=UPI0025AD7E96|nr:uncharacterized protein LOC131016161 isoform X2 [Salvia miltiorrhiza]XP_057800764.1 uncharacterized protein LOC131016161 isoform X2 [Salvia miltiorrhiza]XP_057800765.1 uncharacterized protein LOC131016161 isoform X2 [Salvia miltiorrhiza]